MSLVGWGEFTGDLDILHSLLDIHTECGVSPFEVSKIRFNFLFSLETGPSNVVPPACQMDGDAAMPGYISSMGWCTQSLASMDGHHAQLSRPWKLRAASQGRL